MTKTDIEQMLIEAICKIQELSGREKVPVDAKTRPVLDLPDFDSLNGVEITVELMDRLKVDLDFNNVLVEDNTVLTISQAAARLQIYLPKQ